MGQLTMDDVEVTEIEEEETSEEVVRAPIDVSVPASDPNVLKLQAIADARARVAKAQMAYDIAKGTAAAAKKAFDVAIDDLLGVVDAPYQLTLPGLDQPAAPEVSPLLNMPVDTLADFDLIPETIGRIKAAGITTIGEFLDSWASSDSETYAEFSADDMSTLAAVYVKVCEAIDASKPDAEEDESWRFLPIEKLQEFGLSASIVGKIKAADFSPETLGELDTWLKAKPHRTIADIAGIGPKAVEEIDAAYDGLWAWRQANLGK